MHPAFVAPALAPLRHTMLNRAAMIITCPACATRYVVPDSAIGIDGRTVRCAKCKHNWFQEGPRIEPAPVAELPSVTAPVAPPEPPAPPPEPVTPPPTATEDEVPAPPVYSEQAIARRYADDDETSQFDHQPLLAPRRNPAKMWTLAAALFAAISIAAIGATAWYGLPDWMPFAKPVFAEDQPGLKLEFPAREQERYQLPNGTWYFSANGTVANTSQSARSVPSILIILRDSGGRIVHRAEVRSPKRVLAPGESADINEALVPVPKAGVRAEFGWKPN